MMDKSKEEWDSILAGLRHLEWIVEMMLEEKAQETKNKSKTKVTTAVPKRKRPKAKQS